MELLLTQINENLYKNAIAMLALEQIVEKNND